MKEHAKKALKHDFKVAGKTVPTLALVALFLVGTGSAALLTSFGTVSGTADVEQAIVVDGSSDKTRFFGASYGNSADVTAGTVSVDTFTIENNMNSSYSPTFTSYDATDTDSSSVSSSTQFKWAENGIRTSFVNYFPDAGHDFGSYSAPDPSDSEVDVVVGDSGQADNSTIQKGIDYAESGDTILVEDGYRNGDGEWIDVDKSVTLVSETARGAEAGRFTIKASDVTIKGFEITGDDGAPNGDYNGISVQPEDGATSGIVIEDNRIHDIESPGGEDKKEAFGIISWSTSTPLEEITIRNNLIEDVGSDSKNAQGIGIFLEDLADSSSYEGATISDNTVRNIETATIDGYDYPGTGISILPELTNPSNDIGSPSKIVTNNANAEIKGNLLDSNPVHLSVAGDVSQLSVSENRFENGDIGVLAEGNNPDQGTIGITELDESTQDVLDGSANVPASDNFFSQGTWSSVENGNIVGDVDASYQQVGSISSDSTETVAAVNEFALMLDGSQDYSLTTTIQ